MSSKGVTAGLAASAGLALLVPAAASAGRAGMRVTHIDRGGANTVVSFDRRDRPRGLQPLAPGRVRAAADGHKCVNNRSREGFVAYTPQPISRSTDAYSIRFVYHLYKQNRARRLFSGQDGYHSKQWEVCSVGGANSHGGNRLSRVAVYMTMKSKADRLVGWRWDSGKEEALANATLGFELAPQASPVSISGSVEVHPTYTLTGGQGRDKDAPDSFARYWYNQVNALWEGSSTFRWQGSTHFQGNVGHALWELPQTMRTPTILYAMSHRRFCGHPFGIGCA